MNKHIGRSRMAFAAGALALALLNGCSGDLNIVKPAEGQKDTTAVTTGTLKAPVAIAVDFSGSTRARNIVLDGNVYIGTSPGFTTAAGAGANGWDRVTGTFAMAGGQHTLTGSAEYLDWTRQTHTVSKTVHFSVLGPLPDLEATETANVATFQGGTPVTFQINIRNMGPAPANGIVLKLFTSHPASVQTLTTQSGFACHALAGGQGQRLDMECNGGAIAGYQNSILSITVKPTPAVPTSGVSFKLFGDLDTPPTIEESNESNNAFTQAVQVVP